MCATCKTLASFLLPVQCFAGTVDVHVGQVKSIQEQDCACNHVKYLKLPITKVNVSDASGESCTLAGGDTDPEAEHRYDKRC